MNPEQRAAVDYLDGPLLVMAGAGSGKTRVITEKIARLVQRGMAPERIAAVTFTNKAAREMRDRVGKLLPGEQAAALQISTFHALGLRMLQIEKAVLGWSRGFTVLSPSDVDTQLADLVPAALGAEGRSRVRHQISRWKNEGLRPEQLVAGVDRIAAEAYNGYCKRLDRLRAVDFDDLILRPLQLLEADEERAAAWRERIRYLLVDEYQDTNGVQYRLLKVLAGTRGAFTCVGDDDQSIYGWRGARPENLAELQRDYPQLKVIPLTRNYRSTARILRSANAVIANNEHWFKKHLEHTGAEGERLLVLECRDPEHEAERVAGEIMRRQQAKVPLADCAVLLRANHQARVFEQTFRSMGLPYRLSGARSAFDRAEIQDAFALLRLIADPDDDAAMLRVANLPPRDAGPKSLERLAEIAQKRQISLLRAIPEACMAKRLSGRAADGLTRFDDALESARRNAKSAVRAALEGLFASLGLISYWNSKDAHSGKRVGEWLGWIERQASDRRGEALVDWVRRLALMLGDDGDDDQRDAIRLMTLHASKGLEFPHVFLVGLEDGVLPHSAALEEGGEAEERRLFYVGITRARETLTLSVARQRVRYGKRESVRPSRFLDELPASEIHRAGADVEADRQRSDEIANSALARLKLLVGAAPRR